VFGNARGDYGARSSWRDRTGGAGRRRTGFTTAGYAGSVLGAMVAPPRGRADLIGGLTTARRTESNTGGSRITSSSPQERVIHPLRRRARDVVEVR
jgi:hypothetical protein